MLTNRIYEWALKQPSKAALVVDGQSATYGTMARAIATTRRFLASKNLPAGRLAVVRSHNIGDAWVTALAARTLGLTTIYARSMKDAAELGLKNVACVITTEQAYRVEARDYHVSPGVGIVVVPESIYAPNAEPVDLHVADEPPFGGHILYTSGTTGTYKKVLRRGDKTAELAEIGARLREIDGSVVYHGFSLGMWTMTGYDGPAAVWWKGGTVVLDMTTDVLANFFKHGVNYGFIPTSSMRDLAQAHASRTSEGSNFRITTGGGFLPLDVAVQATRHLTEKVVLRYGSTECSTMFMSSPFRTEDDLYWYLPPPERRLEIVDDNGRIVGPGTEGDLRVPLIDLDSQRYLDDPETTAMFFRDGCFYPGDRAIRRADGRYRILGRTQDVLNFNGVKIASAPLEQELERLLGVTAVCLFTGFNDAGAEEIGIAVETDRVLQQADVIRAWETVGLAGPTRVVLIRNFPRTAAGMRKVDRRRLKSIVFQSQPQ